MLLILCECNILIYAFIAILDLWPWLLDVCVKVTPLRLVLELQRSRVHIGRARVDVMVSLDVLQYVMWSGCEAALPGVCRLRPKACLPAREPDVQRQAQRVRHVCDGGEVGGPPLSWSCPNRQPALPFFPYMFITNPVILTHPPIPPRTLYQ